MASTEQEFGDVIELSSGDELTPPRKRSFHESLSEQSNDNDDSLRQSKRAKTRSGSGSKADDASVGAEEGEIDVSGQEDPVTGSEIHSQAAAGASLQRPEDSQGQSEDTVEKKGKPAIFVPHNAPIFKHGSFELKLPVFSQQREGTWDERFEEWVEHFCSQNTPHCVGGGIVQKAYCHYLENRSGLVKKKKSKAKQAAKAALDKGQLKRMLEKGWGEKPPAPPGAEKSDRAPKGPAAKQTVDLVSESEEEYEPQFHQAPQQPPQALDRTTPYAKPMEGDDALDPHTGQDTANGTASAHDNTGGAIAQLQCKYFPSAKDPSQMCLSCGREGHNPADCPSMACRFCASHYHGDYSCPTRLRCGKCRQLGHATSSCVEKLALSKEEGLACCFCNSADHLEDQCTNIWRSFVPDADTIARVALIVPSCSLCGTTEHYSSDCIEHRGRVENPTWTLANRDRYIDRTSRSVAIEAEAAMKGKSKQSQDPELHIRGHAARRGNVHYSESDDSDGDFLGNKPVRKRGLGQIRMASNIQMPSNGNNDRPRPPPGLPPLPPGPPPAGPPGYDNYGRGSGPQRNRPPPPGQGHTLPPKPPSGKGGPPSWQSDSRNASFDSNRGGRGGGRGGRGGRGKGRGGKK